LKLKDFFILLLLTAGAFLVAGYHPGVEDAEIYVPQIKKILNPSLYPLGSEFFESHARLTLFPKVVAAFVRFTHIPLDTTMLFWHLLTVFLVLLACWKLASLCFEETRARWGGVALVAALLTIPVAGTALFIMDQYLNPRSLALFAALFAIAAILQRKYIVAALWLIFAASIHPLMAVFGGSLAAMVVVLQLTAYRAANSASPSVARAASVALLLPLGITLRNPSPAYREIIQMRPYFFILRWHWYEWLGVLAPLLILWRIERTNREGGAGVIGLLCRAIIVYEIAHLLLTLVITIPPRLLSLVRYQPMRSLQLVYVILFLLLGGLLGKFLLRNRVWLWLALFAPLCFGMFYVQRQLFPATPHIEWPGRVPRNDWLQAFAWIRVNTPTNAIFALNPNHMALPGEDEHGFRVMAERSMLADAVKDSGAITMFPELPLAEHWQQQMQAQNDWEHFGIANFERLHRDWGVTWVVLDQPRVTGLDCPYANRTLRVCRIEPSAHEPSERGASAEGGMSN
jgi:hypothetical protein